MLSRFSHLLKQTKLCDKGNRILLAVSGGLDSMVMLDLFQKAGYEIGVAHCNFELRGDESDLDEVFVHDICMAAKIPYYSKNFKTNNYAAKNGMSIQMAARELRYQWFEGLMGEHNWDLVATAHHANDNLETTILNLSRGTGLTGLKGIPFKSNHVIRPILAFSKDELKEFARLNQIKWREDQSNLTSDYQRNFLRHEVIPKLEELNSSLIPTFIKTNQRIVGGGELFDLGLSLVKHKYLKKEDGKVLISKEFAKEFGQPATILWELIKRYGFNYDQCESITIAMSKASGKKFISDEYQLTVDRDFLVISMIDELLDRRSISNSDSEVAMGAFSMVIEHNSEEKLPRHDGEVILDSGKFQYPLLWRKWQNGDYFFPLGMNNKKKLSDFFIDNKLSLADKNRATVLVSGDDIIWVVGQRIDNRYKITESTQKRTRLTLKSDFE